MIGYPESLRIVAWAYLSLCFACAAIIIMHELRWPQKMMMMNFVWPITALYGGPAALWGYLKSAPKMTKQHHAKLHREIKDELMGEQAGRFSRVQTRGKGSGPSVEQVAVAATHCGAGCTLGDVVGEWWIFGAGFTIVGGELGTRLLLDFLLAWAFGIVFQYFTIVPMRGLSFGKGVLQAMRADTLSIIAFQLGMSAWALLVYFVLFPNPHLKVNEAVFWFMMQIGMIIGFVASYPVNIFLIQSGWKERMPEYKHEMKQKMRNGDDEEPKAA